MVYDSAYDLVHQHLFQRGNLLMPRILVVALIAAAVITGGALSDEPKSPATEYRLKEDVSYLEEGKTATPYQEERCRLDLYHPSNKPGYSTVVWFHGGGLTGGNRYIPVGLKGEGIAVVAANYRLHPKVACSVCLQDAATAVAWTLRNIEKYGGDPARIFVSGHSAGGYLTSMVGFDKRWLAEHDVDADRLAGLIPLSGHTITHMTVRKEMGIPDTQPLVDSFAPLYHVRPDAPPILLITGDREMEMLGRYEENAYFMRMLKVVGHKDVTLYELQGYGHGMVDPAVSPMLNWLREREAQTGITKR
jgi:acetyl esterase/lipase